MNHTAPSLRFFAAIGLLFAPLLAACSGNDDPPPPPAAEAGAPRPDASTGGAGGSGGSGGAGGSSATGGTGGTSAASDAADADVDAGSDSASLDASFVDRAEAASTADVVIDAPKEASGLEHAPAYPKVSFPPENPYTAEKAMFGKILFWEEQIGDMNDMACGTCHQANAGGSDPRSFEAASLTPGPDGVLGNADDVRGARGTIACDHATHTNIPEAGTTHQVTGRKPPTYLDAMFYPEVFWDGRAKGTWYDPLDPNHLKAPIIAVGGALESQASGPPVNDGEMACRGQTWADIATKLAGVKPLAKAKLVPTDMAQAITDSQENYPKLFQKAFLDNADVTPAKIVMAIATHERRLTSDDTPWDRFNGGETTALSAGQQRGLALFNTKARCNLCHQAPLFSDAAQFSGAPDAGVTDGFHNVGFLDPSIDPGRGMGRMKTPSLRNVGLRAKGGLLHNGTGNGATLEAVIAAYQAGGQVATNRNPLMQKLELTTAELADLLDFLQNGLNDPRVKDEQPPFDRPLLGTEPIK